MDQVPLDHYVRRKTSLSKLLKLRTKYEDEIDEAKQVQSISMNGLQSTFKLYDIQSRLDAVLYALYCLDKVLYKEGRPDPVSFGVSF